jgi:hypothetical protein
MAKRAKRKTNRPSETPPAPPTNVIQLPVRVEPAPPPPVVEPPPPPPPAPPPPAPAPSMPETSVADRLSQPHRPRRRGRTSLDGAPTGASSSVSGAAPHGPGQTSPSQPVPPAPAMPAPNTLLGVAPPPDPGPAPSAAAPSAPAQGSVRPQPPAPAPAPAPPSAATDSMMVAAEYQARIAELEAELARASAPKLHPAYAAPAHVPAPVPVPAPARRAAPQPQHHHHDEHDDHEAERFFSSHPPQAPEPDHFHDFSASTGEHEGLPRRKRGMYTTLGILAVGVVLIGGFLIYNKLMMPTPEELGPAVVALPTPDSLKNLGPTVAAVAAERAPAPAAPAPAPAPAAAIPSLVPEQPAAVVPAAAAPEPAALPEPAAAPQPAPPAEPAAAEGDSEYQALVAAARKQGFKRPAEASYLQALGVNPQGIEALSGLAMLYLNQGKNAQARDRAKQALALAPATAEAWIVLGAALDALGERVAARDAYQKCAALPLDGDGARYVGECKRLLR